MTDADPKPKLRWWQFKRRWLRFSLRAFLILLTVGCVGLGWIANRANKQRQTVAWITELGGSVNYDHEWISKVESDAENGEPRGPDWLRNLIGIDFFENVVVVYLDKTRISDVTPLANLNKLELLFLDGTQVRDLTPLANLTKLELLYLENTQVSDLTPLANLTQLEWLDLNNTPVSDVTPLTNLTKLQWLLLDNTQVSKEDCEKLQRSLPDSGLFWRR